MIILYASFYTVKCVILKMNVHQDAVGSIAQAMSGMRNPALTPLITRGVDPDIKVGGGNENLYCMSMYVVH